MNSNRLIIIGLSLLLVMFDSQMQENDKYFCYLRCRNNNQLIVESVICGLGLMVGLYGGLRFYSLRNTVLNSTVKCTFLVLLLWLIEYLIKQLGNIIVFVLIRDKQKQDLSYLSSMSQMFFCFDILSPFILQHLFLLIPYHWIGNIIEIFNEMGPKYQGTELKYHRLIKICLKIRFLLLPLLLCFILFHQWLILSALAITMEGALLLESIFSIIVMIASLRIVNKNQQLHVMIDENELATMKNQYLILITAMGIRIGLCIWSVIIDGIVFGEYFDEDNCIINVIGKFYLSNFLSIFFVFFTSLIPVVVILRIFSIEKHQEVIVTQSLLISHQQ